MSGRGELNSGYMHPMGAPCPHALSVGVRGIEPRLQAPHARVLPLYYTPASKAGGYYRYTTPRILILYYYNFIKKEKCY